jgi:S-adenosylmethionine decarboxylase
MRYFGDHLIIDLYKTNCDLWDLNLISDSLSQICTLAKMTPILPPYSFKYKGVNPDDVGTSGFLLLAESHLSIHTFPLRESFATIDLYTCVKLHNVQEIVDFIITLYNPAEADWQVIQRGRKFAREECNQPN